MHEGMVRSGVHLPKLAFEDVSEIMFCNTTQHMRGLSDSYIRQMVDKWRQDQEEVDELDYNVIEAEVRHLEDRFEGSSASRTAFAERKFFFLLFALPCHNHIL